MNKSNQLLSLVNEIMDLSKLENGKLKLKTSSLNLYKLTSQIYSVFESMAKINKFHMTLDYQLNQNLLSILDIPKYEKIPNNLISNAIKFTSPHGRVTVKVLQQLKGTTLIQISDTGQGIKEEELNKVFDRYYQSNDSNSHCAGTGIGLALSRELAELHQGKLSVESTPKEGTTFSLSLPLQMSEGTPQDQRSDMRSVYLMRAISLGSLRRGLAANPVK